MSQTQKDSRLLPSTSIKPYTHTYILHTQQTCLVLLYRQVNKICELKGGNIGIVEKAQETRFGMSPKYSRYIGIAF